MTITEVRITLVPDPRLRAFVSVTLDGVFVVKGLKVIEGKSGRVFLAMPSRRRPDGRYQDVAHPIRQEFRNVLEQAVLSEYSRRLRAEAEVEVGGDPATA